MRRVHTLALLVALAIHCAGPLAAAAGARTPMGAVIRDAQLASVGGEKVSILGSAAANVLVFFRPDQQTSAATLRALAACEAELRGRSIRWLAVAPGRYAAEAAAAAARAAGIAMPVALDEGDAVYELFGVSVHPTVVVLDAQHRLAQFQPYTKLNFCELVMARIRRVLGEVDDAELARLLDPSAGRLDAGASAARRDLKLAQMLLAAGNADKALELARKGARQDPSSAAAQALIGRILAAKGDCAGARAAYDAALALDAGEPLPGERACAASGKGSSP
jgi:tetratricopeptide (TPR) repeat protein